MLETASVDHRLRVYIRRSAGSQEMNYESINTERLTFEDELTKRDACPVCQLASDSEALQYLQKLDSALESVHESEAFDTMSRSWQECVKEPLEQRSVQCPSLSAKQLEFHFTQCCPNVCRTLRTDLRRLELMQKRLVIFTEDPASGKRLTDEKGAKSWSTLQSAKKEILQLLRQHGEAAAAFPEPPDMQY